MARARRLRARRETVSGLHLSGPPAMRLTVNPDLCTLCGACLLTCPADMVREKEGRIKIGRVMCIGCGHCVALCPEGAISVDEGEPTGDFCAPPEPLPETDALRALIVRRRTIRQYQPRPVPRALLEQMLDAARWAPTAANCQCQAFTVLTDPARRDALAARVSEFYRAYAEILADKEHAAERLAGLGLDPAFGLHPHMQAAVPAFVKNVAGGRDRLFFGAPAVIVIHADAGEVLPEAACAFATLILTLMAESLGLGTCITAYASEALRALPDLRAGLGLPPAHQVYYVLTVGYPVEEYRLIPPHAQINKDNTMTTRDLLRRVLERDHPERIGLTFPEYNGRPRLNDYLGTGPAEAPGQEERPWQTDGAGGEVYTDEWGLRWRRIPGKGARGEVVEAPIKQWSDLDSYRPPTLDDPTRYAHCARTRAEHPDDYLVGNICACAFNMARYLRRLEQYLLDCAAEPEQVRRLNTMVNDLAIAQVEIYADRGADGVFFCEDWGTEDRLLVSPRMWEDLFRPGFEKLIGAAHARGLTVWMHCCGYIKDIIPSLHEIGLDVLQLDQPELSGLEFLSQFERMSYWCPVDIQKVLPTGNEALIKSRAREMIRLLGGRGGGFLGGCYSDNESIGVDPLWQHWAYEVFVEEGRYA